MVLRDLFEGAVTDATWSLTSDGSCRLLVVASLDGTLAFIHIGMDDIAPMNKEQLDAHFCRLYGESAEVLRKAPEPLIENPIVSQYLIPSPQDTAKPPPPAAPAIRAPKPIPLGSQTASATTSKSVLELQQVSVKRNGKKRIRPVLEQSTFEEEIEPLATTESASVVPPIASDSSDISGSAGGALTAGIGADERNGTSVAMNSGLQLPPSRSSLPPARDASNGSNVLSITFETDASVHSLPRLKAGQARSLLLDADLSIYLQAQLITPPTILQNQKNIGSPFTTVRLVQGQEEIWSTAVSGEMTAMNTCFDSSNPIEKQRSVVVVGCMDGSFHILSLANGMRGFPVLVLGLAVAHIDVKFTDASVKEDLSILGVTVDGELWRWSLKQSFLKCELRTNVKPLLLSLKNR